MLVQKVQWVGINEKETPFEPLKQLLDPVKDQLSTRQYLVLYSEFSRAFFSGRLEKATPSVLDAYEYWHTLSNGKVFHEMDIRFWINPMLTQLSNLATHTGNLQLMDRAMGLQMFQWGKRSITRQSIVSSENVYLKTRAAAIQRIRLDSGPAPLLSKEWQTYRNRLFSLAKHLKDSMEKDITARRLGSIDLGQDDYFPDVMALKMLLDQHRNRMTAEQFLEISRGFLQTVLDTWEDYHPAWEEALATFQSYSVHYLIHEKDAQRIFIKPLSNYFESIKEEVDHEVKTRFYRFLAPEFWGAPYAKALKMNRPLQLNRAEAKEQIRRIVKMAEKNWNDLLEEPLQMKLEGVEAYSERMVASMIFTEGKISFSNEDHLNAWVIHVFDSVFRTLMNHWKEVLPEQNNPYVIDLKVCSSMMLIRIEETNAN